MTTEVQAAPATAEAVASGVIRQQQPMFLHDSVITAVLYSAN